MAGQDGNTLVQLPECPNVLADMEPVTEGLEVVGQNYWGTLEYDGNRWIEWFSRFLPVGFYYKAFYKPQGAWKLWEPFIRRTAGLGTVNPQAPHGYFDKTYAFTDVLVIGGGPAGMSAALTAAAAGAEVWLVDEHPHFGGSLNYARFDVEGTRGASFAHDLARAVMDEPRITGMTSATCTGWFGDNWHAIVRGNRLIKLRSQATVIATGSVEQPIVFRNNDLPGVLLGSAAQRLIRLYAVRPGERAVVATANTDGYGVALDLDEAGVEVALVVDLRTDPEASPLSEAVRARGVRVLEGHTVYEAVPGPGKRGVKAVEVAAILAQGEVAGSQAERVRCDLICTSVGYTPAAQLACHSGGRLVYDESLAMLVIDRLPNEASVAAGSVNATFELDLVLEDGRHAGWDAVKKADFDVGPEPSLPTFNGAAAQNHPWPIFPHSKGKDFVDFDEDLQVRDILDAVAEGYDDLELVKRYSTIAMGPSQGRHSALANLRLTAKATGRSLEGTTVTTQRPPVQPEYFAVLAGRSFQPTRFSAMHHRHLEAGARMMVAGLWYRPAFYGEDGARQASMEAEAQSVRRNVGLIDVSTLGGIEVRGPDAAEFLNRMYTFAYVEQPVGRSRYVLMTDQTGAIADDGVACRISEHHFYVTASTGGVEGVYRAMLRWNAEWRLDVDVANVTSAYAGINLAGPNARAVLRKLVDDVDISAEAFPYMGVREGHVAGIRARLLRVGFVGELGYEMHVPASQGEALWDRLIEVGRSFDVRPFGVEAQRLLRLEKGHIIIGQDTDGLTFPHEVGMDWAIARGKPFFVGKRAIEVQAARPLTRRLVGFTVRQDASLPAECNLTLIDGELVGRVTSVAYSRTLGKVIGLAYVSPDRSEIEQHFEIRLSDGSHSRAEVVALPFYDPENKRQAM